MIKDLDSFDADFILEGRIPPGAAGLGRRQQADAAVRIRRRLHTRRQLLKHLLLQHLLPLQYRLLEEKKNTSFDINSFHYSTLFPHNT